MLYRFDLTDKEQLHGFFKDFHNGTRQITTVLHFAGLKSVTDSLNEPGRYYDHNVKATMNILDEISQHPIIQTLIFASSAAVYGDAESPITEKTECIPTTPYGATKLKAEHLLMDYLKTHDLNVGVLRYFNPIGVHPSGHLGEQSKNLLPMVLKSLDDKKVMNVYDGIRDYVPVLDVSRACVLVIQYLQQNHKDGESIMEVWNLGSGTGMSVKDVLKEFTLATGVHVPIVECGKREGDVDVLISDVSKAREQLSWSPELSMQESLKHLWNRYTKHG